MEIICYRIRERREACGMSMNDLAEKLGYKGKTSISKIENGINDIPVAKLPQFAAALHTTVPYLLGYSNNPDVVPDRPKTTNELFQVFCSSLVDCGILIPGQDLTEEQASFILDSFNILRKYFNR